MTITYFANPHSIHDCKWINEFAKKYSVYVITSNEDKPPFNWLDDGIEVFSVLPPFSVFNISRTWKAIKSINKILTKNKTDIVHSMYAVPNAIWADSSICKNHIVTTRGSDLLVDYSVTYSHPKNLIHYFSFWQMKKLIRRALCRASFITSTSHRQSDIAKKIVNDHSKCSVIRTGVRTAFFSEQSMGPDFSTLKIFCPRSMRPIYNLELLIEGFALVVKEFGQNAELRIINDHPGSTYADQVNQAIVKHQLTKEVTQLPGMSQEEMLVEYSESNLIIMIPKSDGTPVSGIEAMLANRPLILGPLAYDQDLFNSNTCWQLNDFTAEDIAKTILKVIKDQQVQAKIQNAHQAALELASLEKSVERVNGLYNKMISSNPL